MQRCQAELVDVKGSARTLKLRKCLIDRTEGERLLTRDCSRQYRALPKGHKVDKVAFQKQCVIAGLKAGHEALPRRKAPAPETLASGASGTSTGGQPVTTKAPAALPSNAAVPAANKSVVKSVGKPENKPALGAAASATTSP